MDRPTDQPEPSPTGAPEQAPSVDDGSPALDPLVDGLVKSYAAEPRTQHLGVEFLPNRARAIEIVELLRKLIFPGFFDDQRLGTRTVRYHTGELLSRTRGLLYEEVRQALRFAPSDLRRRTPGGGETHGERADASNASTKANISTDNLDDRAEHVTLAFLERLTHVRDLLATDVQAGYDGDPAAESTDEVVFCYPGLDAIFIQRIAHELYKLDVPLLPRIMTEYAHNETGIDIHPGASIGESFFIDHGTGVVVGETTEIGNRVKVYQGVTLGALSTKGGQDWRGTKRHPTIEDDVTIYGGAVILGGKTVIGRGATIGGAVFLTTSVPAEHTVTMQSGELRMVPSGS